MRRSIIISLFVVLTMCIASCKRIELHTATSSVYLEIQTDRTAPINVHGSIDILNDPALYEKAFGPSIDVYRVCLFDRLTHRMVIEDFVPKDGGFLNVPTGTYDMIMYNSGSEVTYVQQGVSRSTAYATTANVSRNTESIMTEPEHIFVACIDGLEVPRYAEADGLHIINVTTSKILDTYTLEMNRIENMERIMNAEVRITGQLTKKYLWTGTSPDESASISIKPVVDKENGRIYAVFNTFGLNTYHKGKTDVLLIVTDQNERMHLWKIDVTDQMYGPDSTNEIIIEDRIIIPDTDAGGGFTPEVNDWDEDVTHVPIT